MTALLPDVVWTTPSQNSSGSMPLGNGEMGVNAWVEPNGDLLFYLARTDAFDEACRLLKLGRVRVRLTPNSLASADDFRQQLCLDSATMMVTGGGVTITLYVDANHPVVRVDIKAKQPVRAEVSLERWRLEPRMIADSKEQDSAYGLAGRPDLAVCGPDCIHSVDTPQVVWYHRNPPATCYRPLMEQQCLEKYADQHPEHDPLANRTFGGCLSGEGDWEKVGSDVLRSSKAGTSHAIEVITHTAQTNTLEGWLEALGQIENKVKAVPASRRVRDHVAWWAVWHGNSFVSISGEDRADAVNQGYNLQRYISACAGRGHFPIKFNGSLFTVDGRDQKVLGDRIFDPDYRRWGGHYWHQNTRLAYWPMLASGDFAMMQPFFQLYQSQLPVAELRASIYSGNEGAVFPETMTIFGTYAGDNYGWDRNGLKPGEMPNPFIRLHICGALETAAMMVDYADYTLDQDFVRKTLQPFADAILRYYFSHYPREVNGQLRLEPSQALETWQDTVNPTPDLAGLRYVLTGLLRWSNGNLSDAQAACYREWLEAVPPLPVATLAERREQLAHRLHEIDAEPDKHDRSTVPQDTRPESPVILPAAEVRGTAINWENPELYAVFPYRFYQVGKPDLETGRNTYHHRHEIVPQPLRFKAAFRTHFSGWTQDDAHAAFLGLTDIAAQGVYERFSTSHPESRFPAFWGPNHDWVPDQDHGGVGLIAVQAMLLQAVGDKLYLLPAWPREWNVHFKLHAPCQTTVEVDYRDGCIQSIAISPPERTKDVVLPKGMTAVSPD